MFVESYPYPVSYPVPSTGYVESLVSLVSVSPSEYCQRQDAAQVLGAPFGLPATGWMVRLGAPLMMRTDPELALYGRYCVSRRLREEGFEFEFPTIADSLRVLYGPRARDGASQRTTD